MNYLRKTIEVKRMLTSVNTAVAAMHGFENNEKILAAIEKVNILAGRLVEVTSLVLSPTGMKGYEKAVDRSFRMMRLLSEAFMLSSDADLSGHAVRLNTVMKNHRGFLKYGHAEKIGAVRVALSDFNEDDMRASVEAVPHFGRCLTEFASAGEAMSSHRDELLLERSRKTPKWPMKELKMELVSAFNGELLRHLEMAAYSEPEKYGEELDVVDAIIRECNDAGRRK